MLRYKVSPGLQDDDGTICLGFDRAGIEKITHVNLGRLTEQGSRPKVILGFAREVVTASLDSAVWKIIHARNHHRSLGHK